MNKRDDKTIWQGFVADQIRSVEHLEVLMLLHGEPAREWSPGEVYDEIRSSPVSVSERLKELAERGLIVSGSSDPPVYRYCPRSEELKAGVEELAKAYRRKPTQVITLIFSQPSPHLQAFSENAKLTPPMADI